MESLFPLTVIMLLWVAACADIASRTIRNWISLSILALFIPYALIHLGLAALPGHIIAAAAVFGVFLTGFALGKVGGGDVKLATVTMLWAGPETGLDFLLLMALSGGALALLYVLPLAHAGRLWIARHLQGPMPRLAAGIADQSVPYGVAIAIGGTLALHSSLAPIIRGVG